MAIQGRAFAVLWALVMAGAANAAARSVVVRFHNDTDQKLTYVSAGNLEGKWDTRPPATIAAHGSAQWKTESTEVFHGTQGSVTYRIANAGDVRIGWDNPYVGSNSYPCSGPQGFSVVQGGGKGNDATVDLTLIASMGGAFDVTPSTVDRGLQPGDFLFKYVDNNGNEGAAGFFEKVVSLEQKLAKVGSEAWNNLIADAHLKLQGALAKGDPNAVHLGIYVGNGIVAEAYGRTLQESAVTQWNLFAMHRDQVWMVYRPKDRTFAAEVAKVARTWATGRMKYLLPAKMAVTNSAFGATAKSEALVYAAAHDTAGGPPSISKMFCSMFGIACAQSAAIHELSAKLGKPVTVDLLDSLPVQVKLNAYASPVTVYGVCDKSGAFVPIGPVHIG